MHTPDSKRAGQLKTFQNIGDVSGHGLVGAIFAHGGIGANSKARFRVNLEVDLGGGFGVPEHRFGRFVSLGIGNLENFRIRFGTETEPTKFVKKYEK